jgi:hypothetical protein
MDMKKRFFATLIAALFALAVLMPAFATNQVSGEGSIIVEDDCGTVSGTIETPDGSIRSNSVGSCD